ncbi:Scr1 family TA system antitoxin-like transcriptional regulator [Pilimelia terevasa]|uniref:Scr1 family TA system antitoxin-like transcriptional regulator n=1 Tax=Pilimelia terevasa TaxID=53372 RepID=UPI001E639D95|nr:Scr1 family TA system antitoxin-like transcriptional regulator [Pilimelia terevasa]
MEWKTRAKAGMKRTGGPGSMALYKNTKIFRIHEPLMLPGIFQTEPYMRGVLKFWYEFLDAPWDMDETVSFRQSRAHVALDPSKRLAVVLYEEAIHARYTDQLGDHEQQLTHLLWIMRLPFVRLGIIPAGQPKFGVDAVGFWIHDSDCVIIATPSAELKVVRPQEIAQYERLFELLQESAVHGPEAKAIVLRAIERL